MYVNCPPSLCLCTLGVPVAWILHSVQIAVNKVLLWNTRGGWGLPIQPSIFLLGGGWLFALGILTIQPLNHFRAVELGGPSKAYPHTHPVLAQRRVLYLIHSSDRQATGKGLFVPSSSAQSSSKWGSKKRSINPVVWEPQNSSKQTY